MARSLSSLETLETLEDLTGYYGPSGGRSEGIISEHVGYAEALGATTRRLASGALVLVPAGGGRAVRVLCSELVRDWTEDGPVEVRCGIPVDDGGPCCEGHGGARPYGYRPYSEGGADDLYEFELATERF